MGHFMQPDESPCERNRKNAVDDLTRLSDRHYRPEPLSPVERSALLRRVRDRVDAGRASRASVRIGWAGAAATLAACGVALLTLPEQPPSPARGGIDDLLIPSEAYVVDIDSDPADRWPADYVAIETLLLAP